MSLTRPDNADTKIERLISRARVADLLGVCPRTVKRMEGKLLTAHILYPRLTSYPESEVLKLITNARTAGATETTQTTAPARPCRSRRSPRQ